MEGKLEQISQYFEYQDQFVAESVLSILGNMMIQTKYISIAPELRQPGIIRRIDMVKETSASS